MHIHIINVPAMLFFFAGVKDRICNLKTEYSKHNVDLVWIGFSGISFKFPCMYISLGTVAFSVQPLFFKFCFLSKDCKK